MEVPEIAEKQPEDHMTSAAAFVEGGIQEACDDACSICLEEFCDSDPAATTTCRHEFHMQCILEWCQRSSQCPMCWQQIHMKDPCSQELLEAVEQERRIRETASRNAALFHHPALAGFDLQHLPGGANSSDIEERIIQHLAAAAAMRRAQGNGRRENHRSRTNAIGRPHYFVFSSQPDAQLLDPISNSRGDSETVSINVGNTSAPYHSAGDEPPLQSGCFLPCQRPSSSAAGSGSLGTASSHQDTSSNNRHSANHSSPTQDGEGPSDCQSFSVSLRSKLCSLSMRLSNFLRT